MSDDTLRRFDAVGRLMLEAGHVTPWGLEQFRRVLEAESSTRLDGETITLEESEHNQREQED